MGETKRVRVDGFCDCCGRYYGPELLPLDGDHLCKHCYDYVRGLLDPFFGGPAVASHAQ